jgi:hypothetical protein
MRTLGGDDDRFCIGRTGEPLRLGVVPLDEGVDRLLEVDQGAKDAVPEPASAELGEEALDGVEPLKARRPSIRSLKGRRPAGRERAQDIGAKWKVQRGCRTSQA